MKEEMDMKIADGNFCKAKTVKVIPMREISPHNSSIRKLADEIRVEYDKDFERSEKSSVTFYFGLMDEFLSNMGIETSEFLLAYIETDEELSKDYNIASSFMTLKKELNTQLFQSGTEALYNIIKSQNKELHDLLRYSCLTIKASTTLLKGEEHNKKKVMHILESKAYNKLFRRIKTTLKQIVLNRQKSLNSCSIAIEKCEKMAYHYRKEFELYSSTGGNKEVSL